MANQGVPRFTYLIGLEMIVPYEKLSPEALRGLIEEFVTRPGTDTGYTDGSLEDNTKTDGYY